MAIPENPRVEELLERLLDSGVAPEDVCRECPELLSQVQAGWRRIRAVEAELGELFPGSSSSGLSRSDVLPVDNLPQIPGYQVEALLGRGGMGIVFRARHLRLNRVVALKMILAGAYAGPRERQQFQREAEAVAALRHPNIVQIHDIGDVDGRLYFTMEYVEGGNLSRSLAGKPMPARQAASLVTTLAQAVWTLHQGGIVHRDLKPSNVLLTASDTPKIGDFGLARRLDTVSETTRNGAVAGTPSYMAPEQVCGLADTVGPSVDIYALGAILYEMLTGRPPFDAPTAAETIRQVVSQEPVPPSRLNAKVPHDLETICLNCLQKEPRLRYTTADALGKDLDRFLRGEAIEARPVGRPERLLRWMRRNPTMAALIFTALALLALAVGMGVREWAVSAERRTEMNAQAIRLNQVSRLEQEGRFGEAGELLGRVSDFGSADLRRQIERAQAELGLVERLDAIRLGRASLIGQKLAFDRSAEDYELAFRDAGIGDKQKAPDVAAERVRKSNVQIAMVAALDDWAACTVDPRTKRWVLEVAQQADHDPTGWRHHARDPMTWMAKESLAEVTAAAPVASQSVALLLALAEQMKSVGADQIPFLMRIQQAHPGDFWVNLLLAEALLAANNATEAIRFYQAAVALRPGAAVVYDNLGLALAMLGRMGEADEQFRRAWQIDPSAALAHDNLGIAFATTWRRDEAIDDPQLAPHFGHQVASLHTLLGDNLRDKGKFAEAIDRYRRAIAIDPRHTSAQHGLRSTFMRQGRLEEAKIAWAAALDANPPDYDAWDGYAELCLFVGQEAEYRRIRTALLERFALETDPRIAERTGRACLLLPGSAEELQAAETLIDRALTADPSEPYFLFAKGLAEYRRGCLDEAISSMSGPASKVMGPSPRLVKAMAQFRRGQATQGRKTLAAAVLSFDWRMSTRGDRDIWIFHILRHEAESLILPNLRAFLDGKYRPSKNDERLALVDGCEYLGCSHAVARLYADAFAADPGTADDLPSDHRYRAARAAASAGCGLSQDSQKLGSQERRRWRTQALEWLRADLTAWERALNVDPASAPELVEHALTRWRGEADLAGLRDPDALDKLSEEERAAFRSLWSDFGRVLDRAEKAK